jgi:hypothetical protein
VRKIAVLIAGFVALAALVRLWLERRAAAANQSDPRASALREKLVDSRRAAELPGAARSAAAPSRGDGPSAKLETATDPAAAGEEPAVDIEATRQQVYEEGRAALDEMRRSGEL